MALILSIWLILIILLAFFNIKSCICLYTAYLILVPFLNINIGGLNLQYNLVNLLILLGFIIKYRYKLNKLDYKIFKPFIFLFVFYLIMMPFQDFPLSNSLNIWRSNLMSSILFPFIIWNAYRFDSSLYKPIKYTFITCISIALIYGLLLTTMPGINPYLMIIMPISGKEFNDLYAFANDGRVFGRISSVFGHPMTFGLFLSLSAVYLYYTRKNFKYNIGLILLFICLLNILFCALSLPAAPALAISKTALAYFGFAMTAVQFTIPQCNLNSQYEQIEYTLTDINHSSHKNSFWGTKYVITESGNKFNNTYTDGEYYPTTSWGNQNFGMTIYNYLFTYSNWNIYAWN